MMIERIFYPVSTLGPGERIVIWARGCSKRCRNCVSPEMWQPRPDKNIPHSQLFGFVKNIIDKNQVEGITVSGGDPLEQPNGLLKFIADIHVHCCDILVYTGYTLDEIRGILTAEQIGILMEKSAVLIDGKYIHELNDGISPLIGSTNQQIHYFNEGIREKYENYMSNYGRQVQNVYYGDKLLSVGIHNREM